MSQKTTAYRRKETVAAKNETISDKEFYELIKSVNRRYGKALAELAKY